MREGVWRWRVEWMAARCGAVVAEGRRKKGNGPVPTVRCLGRPVNVCVCLCVPLLCCVGGACVKGEDKGFLIYFFLHFSFLFIAAAAITAPLRHPTTLTTVNTCSLLSLSRRSAQKGRPRRVHRRRGEKSSRDDTYFSFNIFVPPRRRYTSLFGV